MKNLALAVCLLIAGLAAFWLLAGSEDPGAGGVQGPGVEEQARAPRALADAERGAEVEAATVGRSEVASIEGERSEAVEVAASARTVDAIGGARRSLQVVDGETGAPLADVAVWQFAPSAFGGAGLRALLSSMERKGMGMLEGAARDEARFFRTGAEGFVDVADLVGGSLVLAEAEGRRGFGVVGSGYDTGERIAVVEPRALEVRTVDPAGVALENVQLELVENWWRNYAPARTGRDGAWSLSEANTLFAPLVAARSPSGRTEVGLRISGTLEDVMVDLANPEPVTLVVEGCQLVVWVADERGRPWSEGWVRFTAGTTRARAELGVDGRAVLHGLTPGLRGRVSMYGADSLEQSQLPLGVDVELNAPEVECRLRLRPLSDQHLVFRAVDASGAPLAAHTVELTETHTAPPPESGKPPPGWGSNFATQRMETDGEGRVRLDTSMIGRFVREGGEYGLVLRTETGGRPLITPDVELSGPQAWPVDLGDLVFDVAPPLVAGRVVDAAGAPVENARVEVGVPPDPTGGGSFWMEVLDRTRTEADGSFAMHGSADVAQLRVTAQSSALGDALPVDVSAGTTDVELVLFGIGSIVVTLAEGQLELAEGIRARIQPMALDQPGLHFAPQHNGGYSTDGTWHWSEFDGAGRIDWTDVPPGTYHVQLFDGANVLVDWEGVRVEAGTPTRDPRMQDLRLSDYLMLVEVHVVDAAGAPIRGARVGLAGSAHSSNAQTPVPVPSLPADLYITAEGYLSQLVQATSGFLEVALEAAPTVTLELPFEVPEEPGFNVYLSLRPTEAEGLPAFHAGVQWARIEGDRATVALQAFGPQQVMLKTEEFRDQGSSTSAGPLIMLDEALDASCDGRTFQLELDDLQRSRFAPR